MEKSILRYEDDIKKTKETLSKILQSAKYVTFLKLSELKFTHLLINPSLHLVLRSQRGSDQFTAGYD